nr:diguanylate cyclase [Betaproteobacteria bacterium]
MGFRSDGSRSSSLRSERANIERANRKTRDAIAKLEAQKQVLHRTEWELKQKNFKLTALMDAIKSGQVDTLYGASTKSGAVSIQDAGITEENERLIAELKRTNQKFRQVFELSYDGIAIIDADGNILDANQKAEEMLGCHQAAMPKFNVSNYCSLENVGDMKPTGTEDGDDAALVVALEGAGETGSNHDSDNNKADQLNQPSELMPGQNIEIQLDDGRTVEMSLVLIDWDEQNVYLVTLHDITLRKSSEEKLIQLAQYDHLTGLANRNQCIKHLERVLARAKRNNSYIAVLFLDLDKFKDINDSMGHDEGDRLLKSVAARLNICIRKSDLAARFGGDEFVLILDEIKRPEDAGFIAQKILQIMETPHVLNKSPTVVGCSIGIATYPL